jgi:hypothetical protein
MALLWIIYPTHLKHGEGEKMRSFLDKPLSFELLCTANEVLENHFYYDEDDILKFIDAFAKRIREEESNLLFQVDSDFKNTMRSDKMARKTFTAKFCSYHLMKTLHEDLSFNHNEMDLFHTMLLKYVNMSE